MDNFCSPSSIFRDHSPEAVSRRDREAVERERAKKLHESLRRSAERKDREHEDLPCKERQSSRDALGRLDLESVKKRIAEKLGWGKGRIENAAREKKYKCLQ